MDTTLMLLTGGGLVALGGFAVALTDALRDKGTHRHERDLAREARPQDRLEQAYLELGDLPRPPRGLGQVRPPVLGAASCP